MSWGLRGRVLAAIRYGSEDFQDFCLLSVLVSLLAVYAHSRHPLPTKFLPLLFSIMGKRLPLQLSLTVLTCFELPSFPSEVSNPTAVLIHLFIT